MSDLHIALAPIYIRYANSRDLVFFDTFLAFTKDHDIFPTVCSKAAVSRIFHALSSLRETLNPSLQEMQTLRDLSDLDISQMSPQGIEHMACPRTTQQSYIDQNLFTEAVTLCALYTTDKTFLKLLKKFDGELCPTLERVSISRCLSLV